MECGGFGAPSPKKFRRWAYIWKGTRRAHLCARLEQERELAEEDRLAAGAKQGRYPQFLDFVTMWVSGYSRRTVWQETVQQGVDPGWWRKVLLSVFAASQFLPNTQRTPTALPYRTSPVLTEWQGNYDFIAHPALAPHAFAELPFRTPPSLLGVFRSCGDRGDISH